MNDSVYSETSLQTPCMGHKARLLSSVFFYCNFFYSSNHFHSKMIVVVESCVAFQSPFVERFDCNSCMVLVKYFDTILQ